MIPKLLRFHSIHRFAAILLIAFCTILISMVSMSTATNAAPNGQSTATGHYYYVHSGDTLSGIAQFYGFSTEELMYANALSNADHIHSGDRLYIPARSARYGQSCRHYHWVERGQILSWVALHHDIDIYTLTQANGLYDYDHVEIGTSLCIPARGGSPVRPPIVRQQPAARPAARPSQPLYQQPPTPIPPTATPYIPPSPTVNPLNYYPKPNGYVYYTLRSGDTLRSLAAHYRTSEHHLSVLNPGAVVATWCHMAIPSLWPCAHATNFDASFLPHHYAHATDLYTALLSNSHTKTANGNIFANCHTKANCYACANGYTETGCDAKNFATDRCTANISTACRSRNQYCA